MSAKKTYTLLGGLLKGEYHFDAFNLKVASPCKK